MSDVSSGSGVHLSPYFLQYNFSWLSLKTTCVFLPGLEGHLDPVLIQVLPFVLYCNFLLLPNFPIPSFLILFMSFIDNLYTWLHWMSDPPSPSSLQQALSLFFGTFRAITLFFGALYLLNRFGQPLKPIAYTIPWQCITGGNVPRFINDLIQFH